MVCAKNKETHNSGNVGSHPVTIRARSIFATVVTVGAVVRVCARA